MRHFITTEMDSAEIKAFSKDDYNKIKQLKDTEYFKLLKVYSVFFLAIAMGIEKGLTISPSKMKISETQLKVATWSFVGFFSLIVIWFLVRDYKNNILSVRRDLKSKQKDCFGFYARKYQDFIYGSFLLFHPVKENRYLAISKDEYDEIVDGDQLYMEQACISGEVLLLKSGVKEYKEVEEFDFENR